METQNRRKYNKIVKDEQEGICIIYVKDTNAIVDILDYNLIKDYKWSLTTYGYVINNTKKILLHNLIMGITKPNKDREVDHIDRNKLNNTRKNLRIVNRQINNLNTGNQKNNKSSGLKGVCWHKQHNKWRAYIMLDWKQIHLGLFDTKEEAYKVRLEYENKLLTELIDKYNAK